MGCTHHKTKNTRWKPETGRAREQGLVSAGALQLCRVQELGRSQLRFTGRTFSGGQKKGEQEFKKGNVLQI